MPLSTGVRGCGVGSRTCAVPYSCVSDSGVLTSPNYPFSYPSSLYCTWFITTSTRTYIEIYFTVFDIPAKTCDRDFVAIKGLSNDPYVKLCNRNAAQLQTLRSHKNRIEIMFSSSHVPSNGNGFVARYQAKRFQFNHLNGTSTNGFYEGKF